MDISQPLSRVIGDHVEPECGAVIPDDIAWPHLGAVCTEPHGHDGDHVASYERRPGVWESIASWAADEMRRGLVGER